MSIVNLYIIGSAPFEDRIQTPNVNDVDILYNIIFKNNILTIYLFDPNYNNNISSEIEYFDVHPIFFNDFLLKNPMNEKEFYIIVDFIGNSNIMDLFHSYKIKYAENIIYIPCRCFQTHFFYSLLLKPFIKNDDLSIVFLQHKFFNLINLNFYTVDFINDIFIMNYEKIYFDIINLIKNNNLLQDDFCSNIYLNHNDYSLELNECIKIHSLYIKDTFDTIKNNIILLISIIKYIYINKYFNKSYENYGIYISHKHLFDIIKNDVYYYYILLLNFLDQNKIHIDTPNCNDHFICKELLYEYNTKNTIENNKAFCIINNNLSDSYLKNENLSIDENVSTDEKMIDLYFFNITKLIISYFNLFHII